MDIRADLEKIKSAVRTPAYVFDEALLLRNVERIRSALNECGCELLYAMKACAAWPVVRLLAEHVDGMAVSSPFEARLARDALGGDGSVHVTAPGMRVDDAEALAGTCDVVVLNSLSQWERFRSVLNGRVSIGLRVNPQCSFVDDERYDPCRPGSKLGVPIDSLAAGAESDLSRFSSLDGLHFHTNCDSESFAPLLETVRQLAERLPALLEHVAWVNLGGGYLFDACEGEDGLHEAVDLLKTRFDVRVLMEPGAALVRTAGFLVAGVTDAFHRDGVPMAILDTATNHLPEVFEYEYRHPLAEEDETGVHACLLAGASCLAGDLFGTYRFRARLGVGDRVTFVDAGAYSMVKEHCFNGIALPRVFFRTLNGKVALVRCFDYAAYVAKCGRNTP